MTAARPSARHTRRTRPAFSRLGLLLLIGLCVLFVSSYTNRLMRKAEVDREIVRWDERIAEAELQQRELQAELDYVNSPAYIEDVARNQLDMARDGDIVVIVLHTDAEDSPTGAPDGAESDDEVPDGNTLAVENGARTAADEPTWRQWVTLLTGVD